MMAKLRYQDVYPSAPSLNSGDLARRSAAELLTLEFFEAEPAEMPVEVFDQHHILLNLKDEPHRVENWRNDEYRDFTFRLNEVVITPAGIKSGWRWHATSKVIVITLEPEKLDRFARNELGMVLTDRQLLNIPQIENRELVQSGLQLRDALVSEFGSAVIFESLARIFLVQLLNKYADTDSSKFKFSEKFGLRQFQRVVDFINDYYHDPIKVDDLADQTSISSYYFSRLFKHAVGQSPHQSLMSFRIEKSKKILSDTEKSIAEIADSCGFSDQAHFTRVFKKSTGVTPKEWRV